MKRSKKIISAIIAFSIVSATLPNNVFAYQGENGIISETAQLSEIITYDFTQLVKDGADTEYGTASDIFALDDYATLNLTYAGSYVAADGKVYITGANSGKGSYTKGSYLEFTAITPGTVTVTANAFNYFIDGAYQSYKKGAGTIEVKLSEGQKLQIGQRLDGSYIESLSFETRGDIETISSLKIQYMNGDTLIKEIDAASDELGVGDEYTYISNNYIVGENGKTYAVGADYNEDHEPTVLDDSVNGENSEVKKTLTLEPDNTIVYNVVESPDVVFYDEWENILGTTAYNCSNTRYIASGGLWTVTTDTVPFYRVSETGTYQIVLVGGPKKRGTAIYATESIAQASSDDADGTQLINLASTTNSDASGIYSVKTVDLEAGDNLTIRGFGSKNTSDNLDYVLIRRVYKNKISGADGISVLPGGVEEKYILDSSAQDITWSVSGVEDVVIDNNGILSVPETASAGTAKITAHTENGDYTKEVEIAEAKITDFTLSGASVIELGGKAEYSALSVTDLFGRDITDKARISFSSSDTSVISVDENGIATSLSDGIAKITVKAEIGESIIEKAVDVASAVYTIIEDTEGDITEIDTSALIKSDNISGYLVTTATNGGVLVNQEIFAVADKISAKTKNADKAEITPIFTYTDLDNITEGYTLADQLADGIYDITISKSDTSKADICLNGYMLGNDIDRTGTSRSGGAASVYKAKNVNVSGGKMIFKLSDCAQSAEAGSIIIEKVPSIVSRKTKITILGSDFAAQYYGNRTNKDLGSNQHGWGERLYRYIDNTKYDIVNLAGTQMSAKAIYEETFGGAIKNSLEGDIILCECGYYDALYSSAEEMSIYMEKMAQRAASKGVELIFLTTPVTVDTETNYSATPALSETVRETASQFNNKVIDLSALSYEYAATLYTSTYSNAQSKYKASLGISDGINLSFAGATKYAELIAKELRNSGAVVSFNNLYEYKTKYDGKDIYASMNDGKQLSAYTVYKDESSVGVTIMPDNGEVNIGIYTSDGSLIEERLVTGITKAQTVKFARPENDGCIIRLNDSVEIEVDNIAGVESDAVDNMEYGTYSATKSLDGEVTYSHTMPYRYYLPQNYDSEKSYPIIMYLHGAGRRGSDNNDQLINGQYIVNSLLGEKYINNPQTQCIIVIPQCPSSKKWVDLAWETGSYNYEEYAFNETLRMAHDIIIDFTEKYSVDMDRIYISGQSMGGYGTWRLAAEYPELFAAAVPLCSGGPKDELGAGAIAAADMPIWAFHGTSDSTVPVSASQEMVAALKAFGASNVNYTELAGRNHEIQGEVFTTTAEEVGLFEWLFEQSKSEEIQPTQQPTDEPEISEVTIQYDETNKQVTILANECGAENAVLVSASYIEGILKETKLYDIVIADGKYVIGNIKLAQGDKLFVWDSIKGMKPLSKAYTVNISTPEITQKPTSTPDVTDEPGVSLNWDFETDQTSTGGNNTVVVSGTAVYDSDNQNIKFDSTTKTDGVVSVNLDPPASGVVTAEFDLNVAGLGGQTFYVAFADSDNTELASLSFERYNHIAQFKVGETVVASDSEITTYINSTTSNNGGMDAATTHFRFEINYPKQSVELIITAGADKAAVFNGTLSSDFSGNVKTFTAKSERSKTASRHIYLDNLSINSYMPKISFYTVGASEITKRMGMTLMPQYEISKTYADDSEVYIWSVEGVDGVSIDSHTGVLSVSENALPGTARVRATLSNSQTLPVGTSAYIDVKINDFAPVDSYTFNGTTTIEVGSISQFSLNKVIDTDGNDITEFAALNGFESADADVVQVSTDGSVSALKSGTANIKAVLSIEKLGVNETVTIPVKTGVYQIVSSDTSIDVSGMINYGTNTYRIYYEDGFETVIAENGTINNTADGEVTVVPVYKFNFRSASIDGYTDATGAYSKQTGYGLVSGANYSLNENGAKAIEGSPIKLDLPKGRYDLEILRTGSRADVYSNGCQIINNTSSGEQNRPTGTSLFEVPEVLAESGNLNLTMGNISSGGGERIAEIVVAMVPEAYSYPTIWVAGDSESANYFPKNTEGDDLESDKLMMTGFGMQLPYFMADYYGISNMGQPSATSKTWYNECFESVLYQIKPGDIFLMDFGINEVSSKTNSMSLEEMKALLKEMADRVREKGAEPVLLSPVYCGKYQAQSYFTYDTQNKTNDAEAFAEEIGIAFIDVNKYLTLYIEQAVNETGDENWRNNNYQVTKDNLHITQYGALLTASFICAGLSELGYETTDFEYTYYDNSAVAEGYVRDGDTGVTRVYSVKEARKFMLNN